MSGIEVVAAVAGIVSAFAGSKSLYYTWRDRRVERKASKPNKEMEVSLAKGRSNVQSGYDVGFARIGKPFEVGDGKCFFWPFARRSFANTCSCYSDQARSELLRYTVEIIKFQQTFMELLLRDPNAAVATTIPNIEILLKTSDETRKGVVGVLTDQYQRMETARPVSRPLQNLVTRAAPAKKCSISLAYAVFSFDSEQPGDLGFKKGDIIAIVKKTDSTNDWWYILSLDCVHTPPR